MSWPIFLASVAVMLFMALLYTMRHWWSTPSFHLPPDLDADPDELERQPAAQDQDRNRLEHPEQIAGVLPELAGQVEVIGDLARTRD